MISVYIDTNCINARQNNVAINKLEQLYNEELILIEKSDTLDTELRRGTGENNKEEKNVEQADIQYIINRSFYFLEHLEEILSDKHNPQKSAALFYTIFDIPPTYEELKSRTNSIIPKMNSVFQLREAYNETEGLNVDII